MLNWIENNWIGWIPFVKNKVVNKIYENEKGNAETKINCTKGHEWFWLVNFL